MRYLIAIIINIKLNHTQILLVFVSLVYNKNFSTKYIHLKSHFFGKLNHEVYNWPIGWRTVIFLSLLSLLVSHNVGSHTTQHTSNNPQKWPICSVLWTFSTLKKVNHPKICGWGTPYVPKEITLGALCWLYQLRSAQNWKTLFWDLNGPLCG